ncbi:hypothetical protein U9M48_030819 [Paspalum notatum var. saurae]|uniref:Uncharacterized protein n=1 Tax=Paspalum notatum var. saurae TaxID=547442 RepID=A0AAQ3X2N4_PASNO
MRRAVVRNLDGPKEKKMADDTVSPLSSSIPYNMASGYFLDYTLASQLGYSPETLFPGFGYGGVSVFGTGQSIHIGGLVRLAVEELTVGSIYGTVMSLATKFEQSTSLTELAYRQML